MTKLRASDGTNLGTFSVGTGPTGIAFDGANMWVMNSGAGTLTKLRASDGANLGTIAALNGFDVVFDGANIWVASSRRPYTLGKFRASDGMQILAPFLEVLNPKGLAFDGANIWVTNLISNTVRAYRASDGALVTGPISVGTGPLAIAFDGSNIWVANEHEQQRDQIAGERRITSRNICCRERSARDSL